MTKICHRNRIIDSILLLLDIEKNVVEWYNTQFSEKVLFFAYANTCIDDFRGCKNTETKLLQHI